MLKLFNNLLYYYNNSKQKNKYDGISDFLIWENFNKGFYIL